VLYRECAVAARMAPRDVDALDIWECAAVLGRNEGAGREPWPEEAPDIRTMRRMLAMNEGRQVPGRDVPIDDDEYRQLLAMARSGTRKEVG